MPFRSANRRAFQRRQRQHPVRHSATGHAALVSATLDDSQAEVRPADHAVGRSASSRQRLSAVTVDPQPEGEHHAHRRSHDRIRARRPWFRPQRPGARRRPLGRSTPGRPSTARGDRDRCDDEPATRRPRRAARAGPRSVAASCSMPVAVGEQGQLAQRQQPRVLAALGGRGANARLHAGAPPRRNHRSTAACPPGMTAPVRGRRDAPPASAGTIDNCRSSSAQAVLGRRCVQSGPGQDHPGQGAGRPQRRRGRRAAPPCRPRLRLVQEPRPPTIPSLVHRLSGPDPRSWPSRQVGRSGRSAKSSVRVVDARPSSSGITPNRRTIAAQASCQSPAAAKCLAASKIRPCSSSQRAAASAGRRPRSGWRRRSSERNTWANSGWYRNHCGCLVDRSRPADSPGSACPAGCPRRPRPVSASASDGQSRSTMLVRSRKSRTSSALDVREPHRPDSPPAGSPPGSADTNDAGSTRRCIAIAHNRKPAAHPRTCSCSPASVVRWQ